MPNIERAVTLNVIEGDAEQKLLRIKELLTDITTMAEAIDIGSTGESGDGVGDASIGGGGGGAGSAGVGGFVGGGLASSLSRLVPAIGGLSLALGAVNVGTQVAGLFVDRIGSINDLVGAFGSINLSSREIGQNLRSYTSGFRTSALQTLGEVDPTIRTAAIQTIEADRLQLLTDRARDLSRISDDLSEGAFLELLIQNEFGELTQDQLVQFASALGQLPTAFQEVLNNEEDFIVLTRELLGATVNQQLGINDLIDSGEQLGDTFVDLGTETGAFETIIRSVGSALDITSGLALNLQGVVTNDVAEVTAGALRYAAGLLSWWDTIRSIFSEPIPDVTVPETPPLDTSSTGRGGSNDLYDYVNQRYGYDTSPVEVVVENNIQLGDDDLTEVVRSRVNTNC